jgi:hypothetical protein
VNLSFRTEPPFFFDLLSDLYSANQLAAPLAPNGLLHAWSSAVGCWPSSPVDAFWVGVPKAGTRKLDTANLTRRSRRWLSPCGARRTPFSRERLEW